MKRQLFYLLVTFFFIASNTLSETIKYPAGEQLTYRILWGFLPVGHATIRCENVLKNGTPFIRIRVKAKSNWLVSSLYAVDDRIDCYIDPTTGLPLRVEKKTVEGGHVCDDTLWFDHENLFAHWQSRSASIQTNYSIHKDTLDVTAFLYSLRSVPFALNEPKIFNIAVDGSLHGLKITAKEKKQMKIGAKNKKTWCTRFAVVPEQSDLFVCKIPSEIWVTDDTRHIMVQMKTKIPLAHIRIVLDEIQNGQ